jgi:2-dehydro-3-deoxyphosphogluconate aldolase/(4S)-4-hydroxy-2-oxoglutarate aldolase
MSAHDNAIDCLLRSKVIAVLRSSNSADAIELVRAYAEGGIEAIELTTSIPDWESVLAETRRTETHGTCVGLGTVTSVDLAQRAVDAGARFIVSPMFIPDVVQFCLSMNVPVIPGALTPTEVSQAVAAGAELVKVFPVSAVGGASYIKALLAPLPNLKLIPTGGVTPDNAIDFLKAGAVAVGIGSNLAPKDALGAKNWPAITAAVRDLVTSIRVALGTESR